MPMLDMPLNELEEYCGITPKPQDFEKYWEKAVREMCAVIPDVEMKPAEFQAAGAECYDMYFTGVNGARIYVKHIRPKGVKEKMPAVLIFHGYTLDSGDWSSKLGYAAAGYAVFAMDVRGQGGKSTDVGGVCGNTQHGHIIRGLEEKDPQKLLYRDIFLDTAELAKIVMELEYIDAGRVYATGESQGGALTIACAALEPGIAKAAAVYPFLSDYKRVWDMDLGKQAYIELKEYFRNFDPRHEHESETFHKLGYIDLQNMAPRIKGQVLMFTGLMDDICPPSTQYALYNKLTCVKKHIIYPDFGHEYLKGVNDMIYTFLVNDSR